MMLLLFLKSIFSYFARINFVSSVLSLFVIFKTRYKRLEVLSAFTNAVSTILANYAFYGPFKQEKSIWHLVS